MIPKYGLDYRIGDRVCDTEYDDVGQIIYIDDTDTSTPYLVLFRSKKNKDRYVMFYSAAEIDLFIVPTPIDELN